MAYRDWVIKAFNHNKPYDQFLTEQLAGDLLPRTPTLDQIVATGFNRCHVTTSEGGSIEEEVYVRNVVDRVDTIGTVFLGLTVGCAAATITSSIRSKRRSSTSSSPSSTAWTARPLDGNAARHPPCPSADRRRTAGPMQTRRSKRPS